MLHLKQDEILEFVAGRSPETDAERIYEHIDDCAACAQRFEAVRRIRSDFEGSWTEFVQEFYARLRDRVTVGLAIRGLLNGASRLATAARESVAFPGIPGVEIAFQPVYSGVGDIAEAGEAARLTEQASDACGEGRDPEAMRMLQEASRLDPRASGAAHLDLRAEDRKIGEVVVDAARRSVSVLLRPDREATGTAFAEFTPQGEQPRREKLVPVEGAGYLLAEFEDVPDGPFGLRLEIDRF